MTAYAVCPAAGYLLGSIPVGLILGRIWAGRDIRDLGSGKTGTTNVLRTAGPLPAALALIGDVLKGVAPGLIGRFLLESEGAAAAGAGAAVVGHIWPVFAGFRGGRGVATAFGGVFGLSPLVSLVFPLIAAAIVVPTRIMSLMSVIAAPLSGAVVVVLAVAGKEPAPFAWYAVFVVLLIEYKHIPNIRRLLAGTEPRLGRGGDRPASG